MAQMYACTCWSRCSPRATGLPRFFAGKAWICTASGLFSISSTLVALFFSFSVSSYLLFSPLTVLSLSGIVKLSHSSCSAMFCCVLADFCLFFLCEAIVRPSLSSNLTLLRFLQNFNFMVGFSNSGRRDLRQLFGTTSLLEVAPHDSPRLELLAPHIEGSVTKEISYTVCRNPN